MGIEQILGVLPTLGPVGIVLLLLAYVTAQWLKSDARYRKEIERLNAAHIAELDRIHTNHDNEITGLRDDITQLRNDIRDLRDELETERRLRFEAQEEAHRIRMMRLGDNDVSE